MEASFCILKDPNGLVIAEEGLCHLKLPEPSQPTEAQLFTPALNVLGG